MHMYRSVRRYLEENGPVEASAPVRVDLGPRANLNTPEDLARWEQDVAGGEVSP